MKYGLAVDSLQQHRKQKVLVTPADWIKKTKDLGFDGILLSHIAFPSFDDEAALKDFKALADSMGVMVEMRLGRSEIEKFMSEGRAAKLFNAAKITGTKVMASMLEKCFIRTEEKWDAARTEEHILQLIASLRRIAAVARDYDLPVGFENHIDYRADEIERVMNEVDSPYIGLVYDTANQFFQIEDPVELCRRAVHKVLACHFKDGCVVEDPDGVRIMWCPPGQGLVDLKEVVSLLNRAGRKPNLYLELISLQVLPISVAKDEYWQVHGLKRDDNSPVMRMFREDIKKRHPLPPTDPAEALRYETESLQKGLQGMKRLVG